MTVSSTTTRVSYTGNGVTTVFTITFGFYLSTDVLVLLANSPQSSGYSISGGGGSTGSVTFSTPPANGVRVTFILNVPLTQLTDFVDGTAFPSATLNQVNDRSIQAALRLQDEISRTLRAPDGDVSPNLTLPIAATRANTYPIFDSSGNISVAQTLPSGTLSQATIGAFLYPQTDAEAAASVTPTNKAIPSHDVIGYIDPARYGFSTAASAATNNTALANAALVLTQAITLELRDGSTYGADTYSGPKVSLGPGQFSISDTSSWPEYFFIEGSDTILLQSDSTKDHFTTATTYRTHIKGITFIGGKRAYYGTGANVDTARVVIDECELGTRNTTYYAITVDIQTCNTLVYKCRAINSPKFASISGDFCLIKDCWVNGYLNSAYLKPDNTDSVENNCRYMRIEGGSWVPEAEGHGLSTGTRWISHRTGTLSIEDVQFGGENAGLPIVYNYASCAVTSSPYIANTGIHVKNCQLVCGNSGRTDRGVIVLQGAIPSIIEVIGGNYPAAGYIINDSAMTSPTLSSWLTTNVLGSNSKLSIVIQDVEQEPAVDIIAESFPSVLRPWVSFRSPGRGSVPAKTFQPAMNYPQLAFLNDFSLANAGKAQTEICGVNTNPASSTFFNILSVTKAANAAAGDAACVIEIDVCAVGEVAGPTQFVNEAKFRVTLLASRGNNISAAVATVEQNNIGGLGNNLSVQMSGTSTTSVTIQLKINLTLSASTSCVCWNARQVGAANSAGYVFDVASL